MNAFTILALLFAGLIILPITAYMVVKFGAAGYFRARRREQNRQNTEKGNLNESCQK